MQTIKELVEKYNIDKRDFYKDGSTEIKGHNYIELYENYFAKYRNEPINILEMGIASGFSLELWAEVFPKANMILGVDNNRNYLCREFKDPRIKTYFMDQNDIRSIDNIVNLNLQYDIIIDDGSHQSKHMIDCFNKFFPQLKNDGIYVAEDTYQSYHPEYKEFNANFINFIKQKVDDINYLKNPKRLNNNFYIQSIHFYNEIVFVTKGDPVTK